MSLTINNNETFQISSQPFSTLVPSGWLQTQEYEQFLDYLAQQFNDFHENVNSVLDFFDVNKCPERFLKIIAFNLGMEIPLDEDLSPRARALIQKAILIYKSKGTFDRNNTAVKGIGLWIKMATGYDITINSYPILNPYMFVNQFNYRCARLSADGGSTDPLFKAVHPYEKEADGVTPRVMYLHELPKYASEPVSVFNLFGMTNKTNWLIYMFDYLTGEDIHGSDNYGIALPALPTSVDHDFITFFYDNKFHILFGLDSGSSPVAKLMSFNFPVYWNKTQAAQESSSAWTEENVSFPDGVTSIVLNSRYQTFTFRNYVYFVGVINGTDIKLCRFNMLTRETEIINVGKTLLTGTPTAFTRTKFYFILTESGITYLYVYDMILDELARLATIPSSVASLTMYSMVVYDSFIFIALQDDRILQYDIMYDSFKNLVLNTSAYKDPAYLTLHRDKLCVQKFADVDMGTDNECVLFTLDVKNLISSVENSVIAMDSPPHIYIIEPSTFGNVFSAFVTSGHVVYPSTLVINIESYGEFTTSRSLYARKMQLVKEHIEKYVQSGVLPIINDDN